MFTILQPEETAYDPNQVRDVPVAREEHHFKGVGLYGQMVSMFADCILEGKAPPITIADGRHSVNVVETIYRAVKERRVLAVPE
jgi:predicted dehydrogenase